MTKYLLKMNLIIIAIIICEIIAKPQCGLKSIEINDGDTVNVEIKCPKIGGWEIKRTKNSKFHGYFEAYREDGSLWRKSYYKNGLECGIRKAWQPDGFLAVFKPYHNGIPVDTHTVYYDNKKLEYITVFDSTGEKNGWCRKWYENGNLKDSTLFTHGTKLEQYHFYENGKMMFTSTLRENGDILSSNSWYSDGKKSGEIREGNGQIITPRSSPDVFDTLIVKNGKVQSCGFYMFRDQ